MSPWPGQPPLHGEGAGGESEHGPLMCRARWGPAGLDPRVALAPGIHPKSGSGGDGSDWGPLSLSLLLAFRVKEAECRGEQAGLCRESRVITQSHV